jgi:hypothetical protein
VRDEDDREPFGLELAEVVEQRVDLLRDEHGRRLVEDEDARAAVQHLEDLDALEVADAEVLDERVGVDAQAVRVGDLADLPPRAVEVEDAGARRLRAEDDVLEHREVVREHEVLVHHADPRGDRIARGRERHGPAVDGDGALVGLLHPVEDLHERRLAGAVLTDDRVHVAALDGDVDVAVGHDTREPLGDAAQLHGRRGVAAAGGDGLGGGDGARSRGESRWAGRCRGRASR